MTHVHTVRVCDRCHLVRINREAKPEETGIFHRVRLIKHAVTKVKGGVLPSLHRSSMLPLTLVMPACCIHRAGLEDLQNYFKDVNVFIMRFKGLYSWRSMPASRFYMLMWGALAVVFALVPFRFVYIGVVLFVFTEKFRDPESFFVRLLRNVPLKPPYGSYTYIDPAAPAGNSSAAAAAGPVASSVAASAPGTPGTTGTAPSSASIAALGAANRRSGSIDRGAVLANPFLE